jgi:hypothetical protein
VLLGLTAISHAPKLSELPNFGDSLKPTRNNILWIDCVGGILVGCIVLACSRLLSDWENLPLSIVFGMGVANLLYGTYSLYVTTRNPRPLILVQILAIANMLWLLVCITIAARFWQDVSMLGLFHVLGEGIYVATLGYAEWKWRDTLSISQIEPLKTN